MADASLLAKNIKLLVLDVDGVLTDGGLYYGDDGIAMKRFSVQDGLGIKMAQAVGLEIGVITGLDQKPVEARVRELGIRHYHSGKHKKVPLFEDICAKVGVDPSEAAYMGDDWIDLGPMARAGLALCVPNAVPEVIEAADWVSTRKGGNGAVREAIMFILEARGLKEQALQRWVD
ncbi:KdsC family phosphatase [Pseudodesulfovibrio indicus]|uniref:3-deoxy-D-manno-octulosonate 8-phosphate phosphatase KdsC n=1 Tax=Pseudodesulfovibrio indicus TaxID=1716143 RepID=A0A126QNP8_9BACT|nr:HAD hydrolase family protein [Pseudodesulfovibrio indicus]AMK11720.1 phenylphosphate carboxylase subunit delta [Pseudodesulfovibrio indicus]TDT88253.1 3-deoxy-D-manno-octulosonate 8-phosphate phosphatase (KDO 8-P phosphatase) [Pseudodesulfovibrio indicus]